MNVPSNLAVRDIETLVHPYTNLAAFRDTGPLVIERAKGIYVYDSDGKEYIEGMAGLWCTALGYGNEELVEAAAAQMRKLSFAHLFNGRSHDPADRARRKAQGDRAGADLQGVLLQFRLRGERHPDEARLVHEQRRSAGRRRRRSSAAQRAYHGVTIAAASLTGLPPNHTDFDLPIAGIVHTGCPHHYRYASDGESEEEFSTRLAAELEELILREDPDTVAAFIAEPVMGAGGVIVPPSDYFEKIMEVCAKYDLLMIADEVICGFGRLGRMFGSEVVGFRPDAISVAKALSSAYLPIAGRDGAGAHVPGAARREPQDRHLRPRLHLFGPSGRRGGRAQDAGNLCARPHRRQGRGDRRRSSRPRFGSSATIRWSARRAASASSAASSWWRTSAPRGRSSRSSGVARALRRLCPGGGPDRALARRRHAVAVPAADHLAA